MHPEEIPLVNSLAPRLMEEVLESHDEFFASLTQTKDLASFKSLNNLVPKIARPYGMAICEVLQDAGETNCREWDMVRVHERLAKLFAANKEKPLTLAGYYPIEYAQELLKRASKELAMRHHAKGISCARFDDDFQVGDTSLLKAYKTDERCRNFFYAVARTLVLEHRMTFHEIFR